jgi:hypothetical protein
VVEVHFRHALSGLYLKVTASVVRRGGKQPEENDQSVTQVNSIRPDRLASLLGRGEAQTDESRKSTTLRGSV